MDKIKRNLVLIVLITLTLGAFLLVTSSGHIDVFAHPGKTDSSGGHNCSAKSIEKGLCTGYHYHNGGSSTPTQPTLNPTPKPQVPTTPPPSTLGKETKAVKTISLLNEILKEGGGKKGTLWVDLVLEELGKSKTTISFKTVNPKAVPNSEPKTKKVQQEETKFYKVARVVDGDTIRVYIDGKEETVRLLAIDTPETKDPRKPVQCFGSKATEKMTQLVAGKYVRLERDQQQPDKDRYSRLLRYIYLEDGTLVNAEMVKQGFAFAYTRFPTDKLEEFRKYEKQAREAGLGLWGACEIEESGSSKHTNSL